ncbi:MAG: hypothetical protein WBD63_03880 [Phycisphaerae bacterium]|nr:hypothetical protein [Phycisphaerae bacterium]
MRNLAIVVVSFLFLGLCVVAQGQQTDGDELVRLRAENRVLRDELSKRDKEIATLKAQVKALADIGRLEKGETAPSAFVPDYSLPTPLGVASRVGKHFGGIPWGTETKDVAGIQLSLTPSQQVFRAKYGEAKLLSVLDKYDSGYIRPSDRMNIGLAKVEKIIYLFSPAPQRRFYCAAVTFRGAENWKWLKDELSVRYGPGTGEDDLICWGFRDHDSETPVVKMGLEWDSSQKYGSLRVFHVAIFKEITSDRKTTARNRNDDVTSSTGADSWQLLADANLAFSKGDYDKAIVLLERLLADKTIDPDLRLSATSVLTSCHMMKQMKEQQP